MNVSAHTSNGTVVVKTMAFCLHALGRPEHLSLNLCLRPAVSESHLRYCALLPYRADTGMLLAAFLCGATAGVCSKEASGGKFPPYKPHIALI